MEVGTCYDLALVDVQTWGAVDLTSDLIAEKYCGPRIPGTTTRVFAPCTPDDFPGGYDGTPPGRLGSAVRWFVPPHPLALSREECDAAQGSSDPHVPHHDATPSIAGVAYTEKTRGLFIRLWSAICAANAHTFQLPWQPGHVNLLRYREGNDFGWHVDSVVRDEQGLPRTGFVLSVIAQLSEPDEYAGGRVEFSPAPGSTLELPRARGTVAVFPAYTFHRVTEVTRGERHSLTGFCTGPREAWEKASRSGVASSRNGSRS